MECPSCRTVLAEGATECRSCGIILARWKPRPERPPTLSRPAPPPPTRGRLPLVASLTAIVVLTVAGATLLLRKGSDVLSSPDAAGSTIAKGAGTNPAFDASWPLPGSPMGVATNGTELVIGNRKDPWGVMRLRPDGEGFRAEPVPLIEPRYRQKMSVNALTWNGEHYVGLTMLAWFEQREGMAFTVHDPKTLAVVRHVRAPAFTGCLAWDGTNYWAATRRNTRDADEPRLLYRLDRDFRVVSQSESPGVGCQGMAWDGRHLWVADVFSDEITVLDVSGERPSVVHSEDSGFAYLSGIAWFRDAIWVTEYDGDRMHRLDRGVRVAWLGGRGATLASAMPAGAGPVPLSGASVEELRRRLRSEGWSERMRAEMELERLGASVDYDRRQNTFFRPEPDGTDVIDWWAELRDGAVVATWRFWFGHELFTRGDQGSSIVTIPQFAKYTITVETPDGGRVEREFEAVPGENAMTDVRLADAVHPGEYGIDLFMHVQYVTLEGETKILNNSEIGLTLRK